MNTTIDMQHMRYINLFERETGVRTRYCFLYNETLTFAVPRKLVSKAVGINGRNVKRLNEILEKKIKVVPAPEGIEDLREFVKDVVSPTGFKNIELNNGEVVLTAGAQNKAALLGRNKRRLIELQRIVKDFFGKDLRIV